MESLLVTLSSSLLIKEGGGEDTLPPDSLPSSQPFTLLIYTHWVILGFNSILIIYAIVLAVRLFSILRFYT